LQAWVFVPVIDLAPFLFVARELFRSFFGLRPIFCKFSVFFEMFRKFPKDKARVLSNCCCGMKRRKHVLEKVSVTLDVKTQPKQRKVFNRINVKLEKNSMFLLCCAPI
jgi:hypothetical protein